MQASRLLILLLLLAAVLVDLVLLSAVGTFEYGSFDVPHSILAVLFSLAFSQASMAAVWAGLSDAPLQWRLAGLVGVVTLWSVVLASDLGGNATSHQSDDWSVLLLGQSLLILSVLLVVRSRGGRLVNCHKTNADPEERRWQFSLRYLFSWLTATAIALGLLRCTINYDSLIRGGNEWIEICLIGLINTAVGLATLWATMSLGRLAPRALAPCMTIVGSLALLLLTQLAIDYLFWALLWLLQVLWVWVWLRVLQMAGVGFIWREGRSR